MTRRRGGRTGRAPVRHRGDEGVVTAETVLVLPLLAAVTLAMAWMLTAGVAEVRVTDAAREAARALARGESEATAARLAATVSPDGRMVSGQEGDSVVVTVTESRRPSWSPALDLPGFTVEARAVALVEPG